MMKLLHTSDWQGLPADIDHIGRRKERVNSTLSRIEVTTLC